MFAIIISFFVIASIVLLRVRPMLWVQHFYRDYQYYVSGCENLTVCHFIVTSALTPMLAWKVKQHYGIQERITLCLSDQSNLFGITKKCWQLLGIDVIHDPKLAPKNTVIMADIGFDQLFQDQLVHPVYVLGDTRPSCIRPYPFQIQVGTAIQADALSDAYWKDLEINAWHQYAKRFSCISTLTILRAKHKKNPFQLIDGHVGTTLNSDQLLTGILLFKNHLSKRLTKQNIGVCLPTGAGAVIALNSCLLLGKTVVELNYTATPSLMAEALADVNVKQVITSKRFLEKLKQKGFDFTEVLKEKFELIFLEDIKSSIRKTQQLSMLSTVKLTSAKKLVQQHQTPINTDQTAFILFSSGSEGHPKSIALSHKNIIANAKQGLYSLQLSQSDTIFSILPPFHAFGLTVTVILPIIEGMRMVCYPDPTDVGQLAKLAQQYQPTTLCATSTLLRLYAKSKQMPPESLASIKHIIAGAERLIPEVRATFEKKFNKIIHEGYGATELSPIISVNLPDTQWEKRHKIGSVGKALPGIGGRVIDPKTKHILPCDKPGMLCFTGVNLMKGYLNASEKMDQVLFNQNGHTWYQTGDKGYIDQQGFIYIIDRYARFAKVGGEMISLSWLEDQIAQGLGCEFETQELLAVATPDAKKGEVISLMYTATIPPQTMRETVQSILSNSLCKPTYFFRVEQIPQLGSGKTHYAAAKQQVAHWLSDKLH